MLFDFQSGAMNWYDSPATPEDLVFNPAPPLQDGGIKGGHFIWPAQQEGQPPEGHPYGDDGMVYTPPTDTVTAPPQDSVYSLPQEAVLMPEAQEGQPPEGHPYGDDGVVYTGPAEVTFIGAAQAEDCVVVYA